MKSIVSSLLVLGVVSRSALAIYGGPLLSKRVSPGFMPLEYVTGSKCDVYGDRIEIMKFAGMVQIEKQIPIELKGNIFELISEAAKGKIEEGHQIADAPTTSYSAFEIQPTDNVKEVLLFSEGSYNAKNKSKAALTLKNLLDLNCE